MQCKESKCSAELQTLPYNGLWSNNGAWTFYSLVYYLLLANMLDDFWDPFNLYMTGDDRNQKINKSV